MNKMVNPPSREIWQGDPTYTAARFGAALEDGNSLAMRDIAKEKTFQGLLARTPSAFRKDFNEAVGGG